MAARNQQDAFMDDSDESCPLCVEEFDLSDKNFRPCPCGYQVCQFCYNNIKNNMNGLCPACRRPYDDQSIEWKIVSPEEQKADIALQARKKAAARKKESEQRQVETLNRKHLAGLRVVQKNLVYVVGLSQKSSEEEFLQTLRGDQYFGQYGKIIKIVVSKAKEGANNNSSIGVYVTFERREDAAKCIAAVDGSRNLDRPLRAQYGTTKYCSAYLRNETCGNRNCTFLHETGEDYDSFSRQDLSSMNAMSTQRPAQQASSSSRPNQPPPQPQPPPQQAPQNISAASQSAPLQVSREETVSPGDSGDGSALPSSASWAAKNAQTDSRRSSKPASVSAPSPVVRYSSLLVQPLDSEKPQAGSDTQGTAPKSGSQPPIGTSRPASPHPLERAVKIVLESSFNFTFDRSMYSEEDLKIIDNYPPLFADNGGLTQYRIQKEQEQERLKQEEQQDVLGARSAADEDETLASGSLQLGGEPETQGESSDNSGRMSAQPRGTLQPLYTGSSSSTFPFGATAFQPTNAQHLPRTLTPQQQHQLSLMQPSSSRESPVNRNPLQQGYGQTSSLHHHQHSNPFQMQPQIPSVAQGHARHASRFTFANDSASASAAVKPAANPQLMAQQSAMMPPTHSKQFQNQQYQQTAAQNNHFYSGVQGPPPGLKSSGTPPISGGGMFGQGHGFASAMGGSAGYGGNVGTKNSNEELMRDLLRTRNGSLNGQGPELGKREFKFPFAQQPMTSEAPASSLLSSLYGPQLGAHHGYQDHSLQKQKKKGKKHRHANTSSSGGGGIVDLADPSILQARMHHAGAGQGQYGAQGQEAPIGPRFAVPNPIVETVTKGTASDASSTLSGRKIVPQSPLLQVAAPPGLSSSVQDFPPLLAPQSQQTAPPKNQRKVTNTSAIKPIVPVVPSTSIPKSDTPKEKDQTSSGQAPKARRGPKSANSLVTESRTSLDASPNNDRGLEVQLPSNSVAAAATTKADKKATSSKPTEKRQRPVKLDIGIAKDISKKDVEVPTAAADVLKDVDKTKVNVYPSAVDASRPATPATVLSPGQNQPKTIRLGTTPKNETPPRSSASPGTLPSSGTSKPTSRRPSLNSINVPGTPASERISDNASYTSTSMSRANSPPPSKVGSAPVRHVTKSQQRKERQARAKGAEDVLKIEQPPKKTEEPVQAPIVGRKKKAKKTARSTAGSTPSATRPTSPEPKEENVEEKADTPRPLSAKESKKAIDPPDVAEAKAEPKSENLASSAPQDADDNPKAAITPASIFASLQESGLFDPLTMDMLKPVSGLNQRFDYLDPELILGDLPTLNEQQIRGLDSGAIIGIDLGGNNAIIVFPDRHCLHGLNTAQAAHYLELYQRGDAAAGPGGPFPAFNHLLPVLQPSLTAASTQNRQAQRQTELVNRFATPAPAVPSAMHGTRAIVADVDSLIKLPAMSVEEAEAALASERKNTEVLEKKLNNLIKKNKRLLIGSGN